MGGEGVYDLLTETTLAQKLVDVSMWSEGHTASMDVEDMYEAVRCWISGYRGWMSEVYINGLTLASGSGAVITEQPDPERSDYFVFRKIMNVFVSYRHKKPFVGSS